MFMHRRSSPSMPLPKRYGSGGSCCCHSAPNHPHVTLSTVGRSPANNPKYLLVGIFSAIFNIVKFWS